MSLIAQNLSLKTKLVAITVGASLSLALVSGIGLYQTHKLIGLFTPIAHDSLPVTAALGDMIFKFRQIRIEARAIPIRGNTPAQIRGYIEASTAAITQFEAKLKETEKFWDTPAEREAYANFTAAWTEFKSFGGGVFKLGASGDEKSLDEVAHLVRDICPEKTKPVEAGMLELVRIQSDKANAMVEAAGDQSRSSTITLLASSSAIILLLLFISWTVANRLTRRLTGATHGVGEASGTISSAVSQVANASQEVTDAAAKQAAALQQTSAALEQISSMVNKSAERSAQVELTSNRSKETTERGKEIVDRLTLSMRKLKEANETSAGELKESNEKVSQILKVIEEVAGKTRVINDIVFQTKLLSFNASVEAARAGEHGKGFAVVAEEVGNLARMSGDAAREINALLDSSMRQVEQTVDENRNRVDSMVRTTSGLLNEGLEVTNECSGALSQILQASHEVSSMVAEISSGSQESANGVTEISRAIHEINSSSQVTARAAEVCQGSSEALANEVTRLSTVAAELNGAVRGVSKLGTSSVAEGPLAAADLVPAPFVANSVRRAA